MSFIFFLYFVDDLVAGQCGRALDNVTIVVVVDKIFLILDSLVIIVIFVVLVFALE